MVIVNVQVVCRGGCENIKHAETLIRT